MSVFVLQRGQTGPIPASGTHLEILGDLDAPATALLKLIALERSGIHDGLGRAFGSARIRVLMRRESSSHWPSSAPLSYEMQSPDDEARRRRRAADTRRGRWRRRRCMELYQSSKPGPVKLTWLLSSAGWRYPGYPIISRLMPLSAGYCAGRWPLCSVRTIAGDKV